MNQRAGDRCGRPYDGIMPNALLIRAPGINCDVELAAALEMAGAEVQIEHVDQLARSAGLIDQADILAFPGGFSYGDDIASGRILAMKVRTHLMEALTEAVQRQVMMIGVCNGFQVLVQAGFLPGLNSEYKQTVSVTENADARFVDRWVGLTVNPESPCLWTKGLTENGGGDQGLAEIQLPVAHGQGRFVAPEAELDQLKKHNLIAMSYTDNFNGSDDAIAGICDPTGRILGLMPHPERFLSWNRHPFWTRLSPELKNTPTPGLKIFQNAVQAVARMPI